MARARWIICNTFEPDMAWNAESGWEHDDFTRYTDAQKARTPLPSEGFWQEL